MIGGCGCCNSPFLVKVEKETDYSGEYRDVYPVLSKAQVINKAMEHLGWVTEKPIEIKTT